MLNKRFSLIVAILVAGAMLLSACGNAAVPVAQAGSPAPDRNITVVGQGQASGAPDVAHVNIGVETTGASAQEAVDANKAQMSALLEKLKGMGIAEKDIQTSNYSIYAERPQPEMPVVRAEGEGLVNEGIICHVSNQVNVTVRDTSKLGDVLDRAVSAGANNIYGVYFEVSDTSQLEAQAREKAIANAKERAESLAKLSGVSVGEVLVISEVIGGPSPMVVYERAAAAGMGGGGTPIQPGEFQVSLSVQVTYAIK